MDDLTASLPDTHRRLDSLVINVSTLLQAEIGATREYEISDAAFRCGGSLRTVIGSLWLLRTDQSVLASAQLCTTADDLCGSCLEPITLYLELEFDEEFWPSTDSVTGRAIDVPPEREGFDVVDSQIDLTEAVRQYTEMALPMSPRCGSSCPGTGFDQKDRERADGAPVPDERWAALVALREQLSEPTNPT